MTQTKFVLSKALHRQLKPLVVMNKVDRPTSRPDQVENDLLDLFINLDANEDQLEYPILYASAKDGWAKESIDAESKTILPLLDKIIDTIPAPNVDRSTPFSLLITVCFTSFLFKQMLANGK